MSDKTCLGTCEKYRALMTPRQKRYHNGQKRCSSCDIFIQGWHGYFCPCCHKKLRLSARCRDRSH